MIQTVKLRKKLGCQIDYLVQTKDQVLYICEIKFSKDKIGTNIIKDMQNKIHAMCIPKHYSYRIVLIHVNGISEELLDEDYFSYILDFSDFISDSSCLTRVAQSTLIETLV